MDLSIVIVTWRAKDDITRLIESFQKNLTSLKYEVFVVDNNSADGTPELVEQKFPWVHVIKNLSNKGYAGGMNQGHHLAKGKYIVYMNPDMILLEDPFTPLIKKLAADTKIGIIAPTLVYGDGTIQPTVKNDPTFLSQIIFLLKLHHVLQVDVVHNYLAKNFDYSKEARVDQLMGAFIMGEKSRIDIFGPWDEDYPLWWEDLQLCLDSRQSGYYNLYAPITKVMHFEGKAFAQQLSTAKQKRFNYGMRTFFRKNHGYLQFLVMLAFHPLSMLLAWAVQTLKIKPRTQSKL